ncbi:hypothetical protein ACQF36_12710 [Streptomyces sp. Marseille-Q5077]|uniref:hypothetical protein n=1 Tax=Streptomyces sp. Marseille-Q5077 TaxID=3418995 RepID=UPI003CFC2107
MAAGRVLKRVKEQVRAVPDDGIGYGVLRYLDPAAGTELAAAHGPSWRSTTWAGSPAMRAPGR